MKKIFLLLSAVLLITKINSQIVFCPPGAEWHYLFNGSIFFSGNTYNEKIKYVADSVQGTDTLKVLSHTRMSVGCGPSTNLTFIKQKGDTVFFKNNRTQNTWQILYNFAAQPGQSWQTVLTPYPTMFTYSFTYLVQSVSTITVNGIALRQMTVSPSSNWLGSIITERFGAYFLFNYAYTNPFSCEGGWLLEFLCYQDDSIGTVQFGDKPCNYSTVNTVGLLNRSQKTQIKIYPNPSPNLINLEFENPANYKISLLDVSGRMILDQRTENVESTKIDLGELKPGIYFLQVFEKEKLIASEKVIRGL